MEALTKGRPWEIRVVSTPEEFAQLREQWNKMAGEAAAYAPFLLHEWFKLWLKHFGKSGELLVVIVRRGEEPVMIAPFLKKKEKYRGVVTRKIELIGNDTYSPVRNFLYAPRDRGEKEKLVTDVFSFLKRSRRDWDIVDLYPLPEEDGSFSVVSEGTSAANLKKYEYDAFVNWYLEEIRCSGDEYIRARPHSVKKNINSNRNRLKRAGKLEFNMRIGKGEGKNRFDVDLFVNEFFKVYDNSWKGEEANPDFIKDLCYLALSREWIRAATLNFNEKPVAAGYVFVDGRYAYGMKTAYDQAYGKYGVGAMWMADMLKYLIDVDQVETIDFLRGDEPYKANWAEKKRKRKGIVIFNSTAKGRFLSLMMTRVGPFVNEHPLLRGLKAKAYSRMGIRVMG